MFVQLCSSLSKVHRTLKQASLFSPGGLYKGIQEWVKRNILFVYAPYGKFLQQYGNSSVFFLICVHLWGKDVEYAGYGGSAVIVTKGIYASLNAYSR